jgi:hypothetical protein
MYIFYVAFHFSHLYTQLIPICHLLALLGAHLILHVSSIRVNFKMKNTLYTTACTNVLPDDEHKFFETCRRHQQLNLNISLNSMCFVG